MRVSSPPAGFTIVELLVVIGVLGILAGLAMPAVQSARRTARTVACGSQLRQLALAGSAFEVSRQHLPGSWFNAPPDSAGYTSDRGLFVNLLPLIEEDSLFHQLKSAPTVFSVQNASWISKPPAVVMCPENSEPAILTDIAERFSQPGIAQLSTATCDYVGNSGYAQPAGPVIAPARRVGVIRVHIPQFPDTRVTSNDIKDGRSSTLLYWESAGGTIALPGAGIELPVNDNAPAFFLLTLSLSPPVHFLSNGTGSSKSYLYSWAGLRVGTVPALNGQVINFTNEGGAPFSRHGGGCNVAFVDGSTRFLNESIDATVLFALSSSAGGEATPSLD